MSVRRAGRGGGNGAGPADARGTRCALRHAGDPPLGDPRDRDDRLERAHVRRRDRHRELLGPAEFGQLGLLLFFAGLLTLLFTLALKQGTLKRTFGGGDDDDDDDDDEDEELALDPKRSFGTGLITIAVVSAIGTGLALLLRAPIAEGLLGGGADESLLVWAGDRSAAPAPSTGSPRSRSGSSGAPTPTSRSRLREPVSRWRSSCRC